jgi:hypothetical protein
MASTPLIYPPDSFTPAVTRDRIAELDAQIVTLQESIVKIRRERRSLKSHLDAYTYPVLTLPNEVVSEIFLHTLCPSSPDHGYGVPSSLKAPMLLGRICRKWREIALSTPSLWNTIQLRLEGIDPSYDNKLRLLQIWLARSRSCPLCISIFSALPPATHDNFSIHEFIEAIVPHCGRLEGLFLTLPFRDLPLIQGEMPLLRVLALSVLGIESSTGPVQVFDRAPKLENVLMIDAFSPSLIVLPWTQISGIWVRAEIMDELIEILPLIVNIVNLFVEFRSEEQEIMEDIPDIPPLLHLQTLRLYGAHLSNSLAFAQLLEKLILPALNNLHVSTPSLPPRAIKQFLSRSGCHLPSLHIEIQGSLFSEAYHRRVLPAVGTFVHEDSPDADPLDGLVTSDSGDDGTEEGSDEDTSDGEETGSEEDG